MPKRFNKSKNSVMLPKYGSFTILYRDTIKMTSWICKCDCGNIRSVRTWTLTSGGSTNCGCIVKMKAKTPEAKAKRALMHKIRNERYLKTEKGKKSIKQSQNKFKKTEKYKINRSKYSKSEKGRAYKRAAAKLPRKRKPLWANWQEIRRIYDNCPPGYAVDHIVPLRGKNVSGLHVENNLQYLTREENSRKGNKFND